MKFYNKKKRLRDSWTTVEGPAYYRRAEVKRWCQNYPSNLRFWFGKPQWDPGNCKIGGDEIASLTWKWYFESDQDALVFKLTWCVK